MHPQVCELLHLTAALPRWNIIQHLHVSDLQNVDELGVEVVGPFVIESSLNPVDKEAPTQKVRDAKLKDFAKHDVLKLNVGWSFMLAPLVQSSCKDCTSSLSQCRVSLWVPPSIFFLSSCSKCCDALSELDSLSLDAGGAYRP